MGTYRETDRHIVTCTSDVYNITLNGVHIVVSVTSSAANDREGMLMRQIVCQ